MLTIFTVPKPFVGHVGVIQRNALRSWRELVPECQVIVCGDEDGCREVAAELDTEWIPEIERNEYGTPLVSSAFRLAEEHAAHELLCYANADLILFSDLLEATRRVAAEWRRFLLVGEATNVAVHEQIASASGGWEELRRRATTAGEVRGRQWLDFFVFPRATMGRLPDFAVGRPAWDNWMVWRARSLRLPVVDVSRSTLVVHQEHGYDHVRDARGGRWEGPEGERNKRLLVFRERALTLDDATHLLLPAGLVPNRAGGLRRRLRTELILHARTVPLYRGLRRAYHRMRPASRRG